MAKIPDILSVVDNSKKLLKRMEMLIGLELLVGIPAEKGEHKNPDGTMSGMSNAAIGYLMENGEPANNLIARPFLVPGVRSERDKIDEYLRQAGNAAMEGDAGRMRRAYNAAGLTAQSAVRKYIEMGNFAPLKASTIYNRKHRKIAPRNSETPLRDTLQLLKSVTYVVKG